MRYTEVFPKRPRNANSMLASRTPIWRSKFVLLLVAVGFCVLAARAAYVQVYANEFYIKQGEARFARNVPLPADRGRIFDRNGLMLAASVPMPSIWASPEEIEMDRAKLARLATVLGMTYADLLTKVQDKNRSFVWLKRRVKPEVALEIQGLKIKGVYQRKEYARIYPEGEPLAHVVGITNIEDKGLEGIEKYFDTDLAGRPGKQRVIRDRLGSVVESLDESVPPIKGQDVNLSIDSKIQFEVFQAVKTSAIENNAESISVVVLDVGTGEVLAMVNYPSFDPVNRATINNKTLRNRAVIDSFEPGSTIKPFAIAQGLEQGIIHPKTRLDVRSGKIQVDDREFRDAYPLGVISVEEVIQKSSNVGTAKVALQLKAQDMWRLYDNVGFGKKPGIEFPGATSGLLRPGQDWRKVEKVSMSFGYGMSASLLQLAQAYTVFANGGRYIPATLLKQQDKHPGVQVISAETAAAISKMLYQATLDNGTGVMAQTTGYKVAGKTGTVHKLGANGYKTNRYRASFVGFAPLDAPRIVVAVMVDDPKGDKYYGGEVAAPVFSRTVAQSLRILGVKPDKAVRQQALRKAHVESM